MSFSVFQTWGIVYETDPATKLLRGYNNKCSILFQLTTSFATVCYVIALITSLSLIQDRNLLSEDNKGIIEYVILSTVVYFVL